MSADNRFLADFTDVAAIRFECRKCGTAVVQPPDNPRKEFMNKCFTCNAEFGDKQFAESLVREIKELVKLQGKNWNLRLEFKLT